MRSIIVATGNAGKLREIRELLAGLPLDLSSLADHWNPVPQIPETSATFLGNALIKAEWVFNRKQGAVWALADDSGLEVDALHGAPGVTSARFAGERADTMANNKKLLALLDGVRPELRTARFRCVVVLKTASDAYYKAEGVCEGRIIEKPCGSGGFGYDPLFVPEGHACTFAELPAEEKHAISHRGKAFELVRRYLHGLEG